MSTSLQEKILGEHCANYRFFVDLRHKVFQLFAIGNGALLAAYWTMKINIESRSAWGFFWSGLFIRLSGVAVCVVCYLIARRIGQLATGYLEKANELSKTVGNSEQLVIRQAAADRYVEYSLAAMTAILVLAWSVGFFFF